MKNIYRIVIISGLISLFSAVLLPAQSIKITFYTPEIVRVEKTMDNYRQQPGATVILEPGKFKVHSSVSDGARHYRSNALSVTVDSRGRVTFATAMGRTLLREGESRFTRIPSGFDQGLWRIGQSWVLDADEAIYGLGMLQNGKMNQRGENRLMFQTNTEDYANFFQSIKGYGIFWDNASPTHITDDGRNLALNSQVGEAMDYYFIYGKTADGVISQMRKLSGGAPMLPLWTYGFHQSRERYKSQDEMLDVVRGYRDAGIPLDGIIQDWQYWDNNYLWNAMEFLNSRFPDPKAMIDKVHALDAHISLSVWQSFGPMTKPYAELAERGLLLGFETWPYSGLPQWPARRDYPSGVRCYDVYSAEARDIYWKYLNNLYELGIDAWWMDSTDPDSENTEEDFDGRCSAGSWRSVRNTFPLHAVQGVYDHQRATSWDKRVFILTRSYFAGQQRTGANTWSGDVNSSWDSFRKQIPLCLNYTMTACPNVNTDIGGFFPGGYNKSGEGASCSRNPLFQELYVRWLQFGLFNPMMRSHGENSRREIWEFGKKGEPVYDAIEKAIRMRYSLLPYIYSTSWQVTDKDDSFMRPLVMDFASDKNTWNIGDEFMFGRSLLVAPVTHALYTMDEEQKWADEASAPDWTQKKQMPVYLPSGANWYEWDSPLMLRGGTKVMAEASLDRCPLFVKAGSIIPIGPDVQYASQKAWDDLELRVFPGDSGSFTLYEDEGDGYNYERGYYSVIPMRISGKTLTIGTRRGVYRGMVTKRHFRVVTPDGTVRHVDYNGAEVNVSLK